MTNATTNPTIIDKTSSSSSSAVAATFNVVAGVVSTKLKSNNKTSVTPTTCDTATQTKHKNTINTKTNQLSSASSNPSTATSSSSKHKHQQHSLNHHFAKNNNTTTSIVVKPEKQLTKLTLSTSLHQLQMDDSNFITNNRQTLQHQKLAPSDIAEQIIDESVDMEHQPTLNNDSIENTITFEPHDPKQSKPPIDEKRDDLLSDAQRQLSSSNHSSATNKINNSSVTKKNKLSQQRDSKLDTVHVVVGNEACDLDSAVSVLLMFHIVSKMSDEINGKEKSRTLYVPLLNTTRDMLDSKTEVVWFLSKSLSIDKSFLTCKDDIDWNEIKKNGCEILVTLVDHNYNEEFSKIGRIVEIIDHHQIQNPQWLIDNHSSIRTTIDTSVGSCTTLIAEKLFYIYAEHHVSDEILMLIYGTVLLDTINLSEKAKRFTRRDVYLLKKLDSLLGVKRPSRNELYKSLVEIKNANQVASFDKLMRRDLKVYKREGDPNNNKQTSSNGLSIGIASLFGVSAKESLGLSGNDDFDFDAFFANNKYIAFVIMGLVADPEQSDSISRDLVLISANDKLFEDLCSIFESDSNNLQLIEVPANINDPEECLISSMKESSVSKIETLAKQANGGTNQAAAYNEGSSARANLQRTKFDPSASMSLMNYNVKIWNQQNVTSSRKVIAPLVVKVLNECNL